MMDHDSTHPKIFNEAKTKDRIIKKLIDQSRKKKREEKIKKLQSKDDHWSGLE